MRRAWVLVSCVAMGCSGAQAVRSTGRCPVRRSAPVAQSPAQTVAVTAPVTTLDSLGGAPATPPPPPAAAPSPVYELQAATVTGTTRSSSVTSEPASDAPVAPDCAPEPAAEDVPSDPVATQEGTIRRNQAVLAAGTAECRDICRAAGNICTAAAEICRLTGDSNNRCSRAHGACSEAGRRRDGSCPVCPAQ